MEGLKVLYLGGWATSAKGSDSEDPGADLANYALDRVPKEGASWVRALLHQDEVQRSNRIRMTSAQRKKNPAIGFSPPLIIADGDTGHGGEHHIRNLVKKFVESKIVARTDANEATAINSVDDERDHPFVYGATHPGIVPFRNVNLAVIKRFYQAGFKEINGHLLHGIHRRLIRKPRNG